MADLQLAASNVTIADTASLSSAAPTSSRTLVGLITPAEWDTAAITFKVSHDGATYFPLANELGSEVTIPSASIPTGAAWAFSLDPAIFVGWRYVKVQSGTNGSPVAQSPARTITLIFREVN